MTAVPRTSLLAAVWAKGKLGYLLHPTQLRMREAFLAAVVTLFVLNCARRLGKSFFACVLAIEACLQGERRRVWYGAPTTKDVRTIISPLMWQILAECPAELRPSLDRVDSIWRFPNGSEILMVGVNNQNADDLRGNDANLTLLDEAGQIDQLEYLVESVLRPMALRTDGRIVLMSTPAPTPAHPFTKYCAKAEAQGAYACHTIDSADHIPKDRIARFIEEAGGIAATSVRREYFCEHVVDDTLAVLPEFTKAEASIVREEALPRHLVPFVVLDAGFHDLSFAIAGYHDFLGGFDYVVDERVFRKETARAIDEEVAKMELAHFTGQRAAIRRYADAPAMVIAELSSTGRSWSGIAKKQTDGVFLTAATNDLRERISAPGMPLRIHPRCTQLRAHCRYAVWRVPGKDYERLPEYGHFDGVAALTYFVRVLDRVTNPFPANEGLSSYTHATWETQDVERHRLQSMNMGASAFHRRGRA